MKDILFLFHILTLCISISCIFINRIASFSPDSRWRKFYGTWAILMTLMNINGYVSYYCYNIRRFTLPYAVNWSFALYILLQGLINWLVVYEFSRRLFSHRNAALRYSLRVYLAIPLLLTLVYPLLVIPFPNLRLRESFEPMLYYYAFISSTAAYAASALMLLIKIKRLNDSERLFAVLWIVLMMLYLPVSVIGQLHYFNMERPLHPMNTGAAFFLIVHAGWMLYASSCGKKAENIGNGDNHALPVAASDEFIRHFGITPREAQVIEQLISGKAYKEMADELAISMSTVKNHLQNIYTKTGARTKLELLHLIARNSHS